MTVEDLQYLPQRHLRKPDASGRRLSREQLDTSVPLDHETKTRLPKIVHETMGVGYGFDRLYVVDLTTGKQSSLPSRYDITKATAQNDTDKLNRHEALYRGMVANSYPATDGSDTEGIQRIHDTAGVTDYQESALYLAGMDNNGKITNGWSANSQHAMSMAYVDKGTWNDRNSIGNVGFFRNVQTTGLTAPSEMALDFNKIESLVGGNGAISNDLALSDFAYRYLSPSAWEFCEANIEALADLPKVIKDIGQVMDALYNRGRSALGSRIRNPTTLRLALALTELGHTIRRARFSPNVSGAAMIKVDAHNVAASTDWKTMRMIYPGTTTKVDITTGVINEFFMVVQDRFLIAPWWLATSLDSFNFVDDNRELEQRDIERKDIVEALNRLFDAADYEKGLHHGSDSTLPMLLFEKYKEGKLKDFTDFTSSESALAATLLGYKSPREAFYNRKSDSVGKVPYFHSLPDAHGALLGSKLAEFKDRIAEQSEHAITVASTENFKLGMQVTSSFDYQSMLGRTRFGDAHLDVRVYPGGFSRVVKRTVKIRKFGANEVDLSSSGKDTIEVASVLWFPLISWSQYEENTSTEGFLPLNANGAAYHSGYDQFVDWQANYGTYAAPAHGKLWPTVNGDNYWQPGVDHYSSRMLGGTDEMFRQWVDRADTIRTENVTAPIFGQINLVAEMSFDTPLAMVQRNFPYLRKLYTVPTIKPHEVAETDYSFDFMSAGDDLHGMAQWQEHSVWKLEDRHLFNEQVHARNGKLDLLAGVVMMNTPPDNWVEIFQLRDWMMFWTSLKSEPVMDAYTFSTGTQARTNGYGSARLVTYQEQVEFDGSVRDVLCTPILGSFTGSQNYTLNSDLISMYPISETALNDYEMFSLDIAKIRSESAPGVPAAVFMRQSIPNASDLTEDDFVPGRAWSKLWLTPITVDSRVLSFNEMFYETTSTLRATNPPTSGNADVAYLMDSTSSVVNTYDSDQPTELATSKVLTNAGLIDWVHDMGKYIEKKREELEYQHASPTFFVFDKDILDVTESTMRMMRTPFGESTMGPLTFVGGMTAEGSAAMSETITGNDRFMLVSLSSGSGSSALDADDPETDDLGEGDSNPEVAIAEKQEVA